MKDQDAFIDQFFNKELNEQELKEFQQRLDSDAEFREEVKFRASLQKAVTQQEVSKRIEKEAIKKRLKELQTEGAQSAIKPNQPQAKVRSMGRWLTAVAAIGVMLFAAVWMFNQDGGTTQTLTADFYNQNYTPYEADITLKSISSNNLITELDKTYNNKNYNASIDLANSILKEIPGDAEILLIKGISLLEKNRLEEAVTVFDNITNELYSDEANWYAGLTLLKQNKIEVAKARFKKIKGKKYLKKLEGIDLN